MSAPTFSGGDADADLVVVGSGVVGALIADQIIGSGRSVLVLEAGPRLDRAQVVENWRNMSFERRVSSTIRACTRSRHLRPHRLIFRPMIMCA
jgi:fructose 5-dehydrogenase large subunit